MTLLEPLSHESARILRLDNEDVSDHWLEDVINFGFYMKSPLLLSIFVHFKRWYIIVQKRLKKSDKKVKPYNFLEIVPYFFVIMFIFKY